MVKAIVAWMLLAASSVCYAAPFETTKEYYDLLSKEATVDELVESLWKWEIENPFPNYKMSRAAFGVTTNRVFSTIEKIELIYRMRELRRGQSLCIKREGKKFRKMMSDSSIHILRRKAMAKEFNVMHYAGINFLKTDECKKMVDFLSSSTVGFEGLLNHLISHEKAIASDRLRPIEVRRCTKPLVEMTRAEQITWLYRIQEMKNVRRLQEEANRRTRRPKYFQSNEPGKPPVKPYRVKSR